MELIFLGNGAGFNPAGDSTSAYFIDNGTLFLIDCGESVFKILRERELLDTVSALNVFLTHTHSDHTGSLGSLVLYANMVKGLTTTIIVDANVGYRTDIHTLLRIFGTTEDMYCFSDVSALTNRYSRFNRVRYIKTTHCDELESCGIVFETDQGLVFYSGDIHDPAPLLEIITSGCPIDALYVDANNDREPNIHHISIHLLNDIVSPQLKPKIHCMHLNTSRCAEEARAYGFDVVSCP